jgi:hypothetical protein
LFLSSRWGKTLDEIDALPASEFIQHKLFWERFRWGLVDDLLAICVSQLVSFRTGKKPDSESYTWKDYALFKSGEVIKRITDTPVQKIRQAFMMLAQVIGKKDNGGKNNP